MRFSFAHSGRGDCPTRSSFVAPWPLPLVGTARAASAVFPQHIIAARPSILPSMLIRNLPALAASGTVSYTVHVCGQERAGGTWEGFLCACSTAMSMSFSSFKAANN